MKTWDDFYHYALQQGKDTEEAREWADLCLESMCEE